MARRVEKFRPEDMSPDQLAIYNAIAKGPRMSRPQLFPMVDPEGLLEGPWNVWLINPVIGKALEVAGSAYHEGLAAITPRCREIAALIVGRRLKCDFILFAHIRVGRNVGLTDEEIDRVLAGDSGGFTDEAERVTFETTEAMLEHHDLDDAEYDRAFSVLGLEGVWAVSWVACWYTVMAIQLNVFRVPLPEGCTVGS